MNTDEHTFISGITRSGKTTYARFLYENYNGLRVFYNTQLEVQIERASDAVCYDMAGFRKAFNKGYRKICYNPNEDAIMALADLEALVRTLFGMGYTLNKNVSKTPKVWCFLFIDEVQEYSGKEKNPNIDRVWKRGKRYGIVGIAISQRPAEVSHSILSQSYNHVIFNMSQYEMPYFQRYHIPIEKEEIKTHIKKKHHFVIFAQDGSYELYPPVSI